MKSIKTLLLIAAVTVISILSFGPLTSAQSSNTAAQGLELSPTLIELNAEKGQTYNVNLKLRNVTVGDLVYNVSVDDFNASDETGSPHVITDSNLPRTASIRTWVSTIPQFSLATRELKEISAKITVPTDAEPGGHYGVLRFSGVAPEVDTTGVGLSASAGVLILVRVDGDISETAKLESFFSASPEGNQTSFFENSPINFVTRIKNEGNIHIKPIGNIEIRDMFGNVTATVPVNDNKSNILPDSIRRFETQYNSDWMMGQYTANLTLGYGTTGQAITGTINFWVIPYKIILAGLAIIITLIYIFKTLIKSYNKRIAEKVRHEIANKNHQEKKD